MNPYKAVQGNLPSKQEFSEWSTDKWIVFLNFLLHFSKKEGKGDIYKVTKEKIQEMEAFLQTPEHPFNEHTYRMNLWVAKTNPRQYFYKLNAYSRIGLSYLKNNPGHVSPEMKEIMESSDRLSWAIHQYTTEETNAGEVLARDTTFVDGFSRRSKDLPSLQATMATALLKIADVYEAIADSITTQELKKLDTKDKLSALAKLSFIFQAAQKKQGTNHFTQININGDVKDAEKEMLNYVKRRN